MLITISGLPGSGKTTVARLVARDLGLEHVYAGNIFRHQAEAQGLTLLFGLPEEDLPTVWADSQRVTQILRNLISNSLKFSEHGGRPVAMRFSKGGWPRSWRTGREPWRSRCSWTRRRPCGRSGSAGAKEAAPRNACARSRYARRPTAGATVISMGSITTIWRGTIS